MKSKHSDRAPMVRKALSLKSSQKRLDAREHRILTLRFVEESTLESIGKGLGITRERVRQIEAKAVEKLLA